PSGPFLGSLMSMKSAPPPIAVSASKAVRTLTNSRAILCPLSVVALAIGGFEDSAHVEMPVLRWGGRGSCRAGNAARQEPRPPWGCGSAGASPSLSRHILGALRHYGTLEDELFRTWSKE